MVTIPTKTQIYFGNYFTKTKTLFWQKKLLYTQSPNVILTHTYKTQILFLTLALHVLNPSLMGNIITHPLRNTFLTRFIKPMYITHDKTIHFVGITKPKEAQLQSPAELA